MRKHKNTEIQGYRDLQQKCNACCLRPFLKKKYPVMLSKKCPRHTFREITTAKSNKIVNAISNFKKEPERQLFRCFFIIIY